MKVYTLGSGFVSRHLPYDIISERIELNSEFINSLLDKYKPDVLVNCIGRTGTPNVDWCENNKGITAVTNTALPILLADACAKKSIHFIQIGSGCIFYGESPNSLFVSGQVAANLNDSNFSNLLKIDKGWKESDFANPESYYSKTKFACDLVLDQMSDVCNLRIRMPISEINHSRNLINKLKGYSKVIDIPNSVTFMKDLVKCVDWAVNNSKIGTYHVTNPQPITAAQIMKEYQKYFSEHHFKIIDEQELGSLTIAKRSNCILDTSKLQNAGFFMTNSELALKECMANYIKNI